MNRPMDRSFGSDGWEVMVDKSHIIFCNGHVAIVHGIRLIEVMKRSCNTWQEVVWGSNQHSLGISKYSCILSSRKLGYPISWVLSSLDVSCMLYFFLSDWLMCRCFKHVFPAASFIGPFLNSMAPRMDAGDILVSWRNWFPWHQIG